MAIKERVKKDSGLKFPIIDKLFANKYLIDNFNLMPDQIDQSVIDKLELAPKKMGDSCKFPEEAFYEIVMGIFQTKSKGRPREVT